MLLRKSRGRENIFIALYVFTEEHLCVSRPMQFNPGCSKFNYIIKKKKKNTNGIKMAHLKMSL